MRLLLRTVRNQGASHGGTLLSAMPARGTDGARVVDEANGVLKSMLLEPVAGAQPALVKREKGTERQYR